MKLGNVLKSFVAVAAILFASHANAQDVELATNLGFEDQEAIGGVGDETPGQWNPFVGDGAVGAGTGTTAPLNGATHGELTIDGTGNSFAGLQYQVDGIAEGLSYTFSFSARSAGPDLGGVQGEFRFEFLDSAGNIIGNQFALNIELFPTDTYACLLYTSPSPRDQRGSRMPSSA